VSSKSVESFKSLVLGTSARIRKLAFHVKKASN